MVGIYRPIVGKSIAARCGTGLQRKASWRRDLATQSERREKTKGAVVKAARRIFGERGFAVTTMDDIASGARVAKGAVYHHFKTKEELFGAVFDQVSRDLVRSEE